MRRRLVIFASTISVLLVSATLGVVGVAGASSDTTPLDGQWRGDQLFSISGTLGGGFTVNAAETFTIRTGCPVPSGTLIVQLAPSGGGQYGGKSLYVSASSNPTPGGPTICENSTVGPYSGYTVALSGSTLNISPCYFGECTMTRVEPKPATTTTQPTKATTTTTQPKKPPKKDTKRPVVIAINKGVTYPGTSGNLQFNVYDDSGNATASVALFQGGALISKATLAVVNGIAEWKDVAFSDDLTGPLYFYVGASDAAGNKAKASLGWIQLLVPIEKVSNGCGGGEWDTLVKTQNYFGNEHSYQESLGNTYDVNFADACNLHDAAYGGYTVEDKINGGPPIDFHSWSRSSIDQKFLKDMRTLCTRSIPASAQNALKKCTSTGGGLSIGAQLLYKFVNKHGYRFFDADLKLLGTQTHGTRANFNF